MPVFTVLARINQKGPLDSVNKSLNKGNKSLRRTLYLGVQFQNFYIHT